MKYDTIGSDPATALSRYLNARTKSGNWRGKREQHDGAALAAAERAYTLKIDSAIEALRFDVAQVCVDETCAPGMLSVRFAAGQPVHIPASAIPADLHAEIVKELGAAAGKSWKVA